MHAPIKSLNLVVKIFVGYTGVSCILKSIQLKFKIWICIKILSNKLVNNYIKLLSKFFLKKVLQFDNS